MGRIPRAMYRKFAHILMYVWCSNEREETRHTGPLGKTETLLQFVPLFSYRTVLSSARLIVLPGIYSNKYTIRCNTV